MGGRDMKVVLFCGGMGLRLREYSMEIPKPMVPIGPRPLVWHLMKYYAHFGYKDFILCLGWQGNVIKDYFRNYDECVSNDFVLRNGAQVDLLRSDISDWTITFVDTGLNSNLAQRLTAVRPYLEGEECFLANYSDGLTDFHLPALIDQFHSSDSIATFLSVRPRLSFHLMDSDDDGWVTRMTPITNADLWINAGYFALRQEIFSYIRPGEELVVEPFGRLVQERRLTSYKYNGFWACMDTYKEKQILDDVYHRGDAPWTVWKTKENSGTASESFPSGKAQREGASVSGDSPSPKGRGRISKHVLSEGEPNGTAQELIGKRSVTTPAMPM
jgi:glucose-1-phosphate cytidylyltransferase